jgi:hypothetical protein
MLPARRHFLLVTTGCLLTGFVAGCGTTGPCGPEVRDATASTSENTSLGADYALISVGQSRGAPDHVSWVAQNTTVAPGDTVPYRLEQHVVAARLRDGAADGVVLLELPLQGLEGFDGVGGTLEIESGSLSDRVLQAVRAGHTVLEMDTDIPGQEHLSRPLGIVSFQDWHRLTCD